MPSINLNNLERYDSKARNEAEEEYMPKDSGNWQKTDEAGAVVFYPVPNTPLEGKVKFSFTETPPANGDKGPDNPSTITGVSSVEVTRCGDNILPGNRKSNYSGEAGTFSTDADGYVSYSAMSDGRAFVYSLCNAQVYLHAGQQYVLRTEVKTAATSSYRTTHILDEDNTSVLAVSPGDSDNSHTFTPSHDGMYGVLYKIYDGVYRFSLYLGSTAASFEPYAGTDYTLPLGNTYYGGTLDVASGVMTVTWAGGAIGTFTDISSVNTNTIAINYFTGGYHEGDVTDITNYLSCNRFVVEHSIADREHCRFGGNINRGNKNIRFWIDKSRLDVSGAANPSSPTNEEWVAAANAWQVNNPIQISYKLFTPTTVQLSPTEILSLAQTDKCMPRLNTVYTDADTIQIGYMKSPQRTEQELTQAVLEIESDDSD